MRKIWFFSIVLSMMLLVTPAVWADDMVGVVEDALILDNDSDDSFEAYVNAVAYEARSAGWYDSATLVTYPDADEALELDEAYFDSIK